MSFQRFPTWVDGRLVPPGEASLPADAAGLLLGLGLFETLALHGGRRPFEAAHLERMERGAAFLDLPFERSAARAALAEYAQELAGLAPAPDKALALRLTLLAGPAGRGSILVVGAREVEAPPPEGVEVCLEARALLARDPLSAFKILARARHTTARLRARRLGAWDALLGSDEGDYVEASAANLFLVRAGRVLTPALERGCLPGITRARLLAALRARGLCPLEGRIEIEDLAQAEEVFLTSSVSGLVPVRVVQGLRPTLPGPGGHWARLARALLASEAPANDKGTLPGPAQPPAVEEST